MAMDEIPALETRAATFAALGEPIRLALVDRLVLGDASPGELADEVGLGSNLLAHHLRVLQRAGVIRRVRSEGDHRRSYVQLRLDNPTVLAAAVTGELRSSTGPIRRVLFVCTANSARSQLAAAIWNQLSSIPAVSAGTHPGPRIHPRAMKLARRRGLPLEERRPAHLDDVLAGGDLVVAVCDSAHEELHSRVKRLHWSIPDPVRVDADHAFETAYSHIERRVHNLADTYEGNAPSGLQPNQPLPQGGLRFGPDLRPTHF